MALHLITGPANAGKRRLLHAYLQEPTRQRSTSLLLVPAGPDVSRELEISASTIPLGLAIRTFTGFLDHLWAIHGDGRAIVTPVQRRALLEESGTTWQTDSLLASSRSHGMLTALATLVQRAAEAPAFDASSSMSLEGDEAGSAGAALLDCVLRYQALLSRARLIERAEAHRRVIDQLAASDLPGLIAVDHFTGLTAAQEAFVVAASARTEVVVTLTYDRDVPATLAAAELVGRLTERAASTRHLSGKDAPPGPAELARIARSLGGFGNVEVPAAGAVILSESWGPATEAARIVREVQDAVSAGIAPERIAVVFREAGLHLPALRRALAESGVQAEFDAQIVFQTTSLGRVLLALLKLESGALTYRGLMDALRSPFSPTDDATLDELDARARAMREPTAGLIARWCEAAHPATARFLRDARRASRDLGAPASESSWYQLISGMLRRACPAGPTTDLEPSDAAAARIFMEAVSGLSALQVQRDGARVLESALCEARVTLISSDRPGFVQVMGAERVRGRRYECVILGGLKAGEFPRRASDDALSSPDVTRALARHGIDTRPRGGVDDERLMFYQVVTRAARRLVLSWQSHDGEGRPLRPSVFLEEVLDLYRDPVSGSFFAGMPPHHTLGLDAQAEHPAAPRSVRRTERSWASAGSTGDEAASERLRDARRRATRTPAGCSAQVRELMGGREVFSSSDIETYLQCPFRWYVERLVRPRELDEALDAAAAGSLAHEIMREFLDTFLERTGERRVRTENLAVARTIHAEVALHALERLRTTSAAEAALARATARRTGQLVEADATLLPELEPTHREWSFGLEAGDPPESLGDFALAGRVDRIDSDASRLVVTDYKLGAVDQRRAIGAFEKEGIVQLPLYAAVAARRLGLSVAGGLYRSVRASKPRGFVRTDLASPAFVRTDVVDADAIDSCLAFAIERANAAVAGMRSGDIHPEPRGGVCPPYCAARSHCAEWRGARA